MASISLSRPRACKAGYRLIGVVVEGFIDSRVGPRANGLDDGESLKADLRIASAQSAAAAIYNFGGLLENDGRVEVPPAQRGSRTQFQGLRGSFWLGGRISLIQ